MKILVTGSEGVIGSQLVEKLKSLGYDVFCLDIRQSGEKKYFECDVASFEQLADVFAKEHFDYVYHLAALFGRKRGEDRYSSLWQTNVIGTKNIIRFQEKYHFRLIHFSSSEIYGDYQGVMTEDVPDKFPIRQLNDYAMSKAINEMQILNSAEQFGTATVRVRLFNLYGKEAYSPYRSVICKFIYKALNNQPYTVYLNYFRTSIFIDDAVELLSRIVANFSAGEVYNIGGIEHHDIKSISNTILKSLKKNDSLVSYEELDKLTTRDKRVDSLKAYKAFDYTPKVKLEEGISATIEWMKRRQV